MSDYRRYFVPGGTYFFTVVVHQRYPLFDNSEARRMLRESILSVREDWSFNLFAICLLPDHFHTVIVLPSGDSDYPKRMRKIKERFTTPWLESGGWEGTVSESRRKKGERGIWQRRYWEHTITDDDDLKHCVDYTHWNPRKHELVRRVRDWPYSTFHQFVQRGEYDLDWGGVNPCFGWNAPDEWGE